MNTGECPVHFVEASDGYLPSGRTYQSYSEFILYVSLTT